MYFLALAADFDGTIAHDGKVSPAAYDALSHLKKSGRQLLLVTGRELQQLKETFPRFHIFDRIVAENGAVIYDPASNEERTLAPPPLPALIAELKHRKVEPLSVGECIVATWEPHEKTVLEVIRDLGLELQVIFNKGAIMILPPGVNKATGLRAALSDLELPAHNTVAAGDAENDHAFLESCGCSVAVANAIPQIKQAADIVLSKERGDGIVELAERMLADEGSMLVSNRPRLHPKTI